MSEYTKEHPQVYLQDALFVCSGHHRMTEMTDLKRSEKEVGSGIADIAKRIVGVMLLEIYIQMF